VTLLIGQQATFRGARAAARVITFGTAASLREELRLLAGDPVQAVFHAAAVSDFGFGKIWSRAANGDLTEVRSGKISSRQGTLLAELVPTPKIISELRGWFPRAAIVGWKYEVDGDRADVVHLGREQIAACRTNACVLNGPAYGDGFGVLAAEGECAHVAGASDLYLELDGLARRETPRA
jgi:phosphopantothenoylcysteine decarboxylase/phosphopantothenate--cysteine ligase